MGAWGTGNFENDQALDWVGDILESDSIKPIEEALMLASGKPTSFFQKVFKSRSKATYLDADIASNALAAAEVVAALRHQPCESLPDGLSDWVDKHSPHLSISLVALATQAIERVQSDSELAELWAESEELDNLNAELLKFKARLA